MTVRLIVLFTHLCGMLMLFMAFAVEWLVLALSEDPTAGEHSRLTTMQPIIQRVYGIGSGVLLLSGIYLARGGYFEFWWVRGPLILLVIIGLLGGIARRASTGARRTSLVVCLALALAAVYLMVVKPW